MASKIGSGHRETNRPLTITSAASLIRQARRLIAFTGAGISIECGIPPFRGPGSLRSWTTFLAHPEKPCPVIREIFYDHFAKARPNTAHEGLAAWEGPGSPAMGKRLPLSLLGGVAENFETTHSYGNQDHLHQGSQPRSALILRVRPREPFTPLAGLVLRQDRPMAEEGCASSLRLGYRGPHRPANRDLQHHQSLFVTIKTTMLSPLRRSPSQSR